MIKINPVPAFTGKTGGITGQIFLHYRLGFSSSPNVGQIQHKVIRSEMLCPQCQANNPCEAKYCMNCGTSLVLVCPNCSTQNANYANYCIECGYSLRDAEPAATGRTPKNEVNSIKRFIPKEYAEKLDTARRSQSMKGERRIVSILFCDVKGSTSMAEQLDPEEWAEIMNQAFEYLISPGFFWRSNCP